MWRDPRPLQRQRQDIDEEDLPMVRVFPPRLSLAGLLALLLCLGTAGVVLAQSGAAHVTPEKAKQFINHRLNVESQAAGNDDKIARLRTLLRSSATRCPHGAAISHGG